MAGLMGDIIVFIIKNNFLILMFIIIMLKCKFMSCKMEFYNATYDDGNVKFDTIPKRRKGRVIVTFIDDKNIEIENITLPEYDLGAVISDSREDLYESRLSH